MIIKLETNTTCEFHKWVPQMEFVLAFINKMQSRYNLLMENTNTAPICRKVRDYTQNGVGGGLEASSTPPTKVLIIGLGQLGLPVLNMYYIEDLTHMDMILVLRRWNVQKRQLE